MAKTKRLPSRSEVKPEDTWDLAPLYKNDPAWEKAFQRLSAQIGEFSRFRGQLGKSAATLRACYDFNAAFDREAERLQSYVFLKSSEDVANGVYQGMLQRFIHVATVAQEAASFIAPEIQAIPKKKMDAFLKSKELAPYRFALEKLLRYRPHILSESEERLLAMQGEIAGSPDRIFEQLNDADLKFGRVVDEKGNTVELTQGSFRSLLESPKRAVRKTAFEQFYKQYEAHANTLAATLTASVLQDVYHARVRNHSCAIGAALFSDNVPVNVYDSLIKAVHSQLDSVHHYFDVRRKALKLKEIHVYDTYAPIVSQGRTRIPYPKAVDMICSALAPLGDDYCRVLRAGLLGRWVDRYENQGKRSGAFSAGGYDGPPYILMNYREDVLDSVFTLAHEAGHSMHTQYSAKTQPYQYYGYSIFVAEVASTFNEQLLNAHLLAKADDKAARAFLLNREIDEIRGTIVRQTMFAEFEKITHALAESGEALTLDVLRAEYRKLLERYFGKRFALDDALSLECLRIPHFYHAFYVYKYATGLSAAIALSERVMRGGDAERKAYLAFLSGGGSKYPLDLLRDAGVDMERPEPVATAMKRFKRLVRELEELT
ncbi:MAG TPA: oligoendopeptidase F [Candidatus Hydrogenedentes bacterium]|nr:oligoendopeptidase F [Candidatus Hydrogenedentota bacterium]